eukprot:CAMPEP_0168554688 /NCGR_PEP_ID=MMETSP0413-20121227/7917_1 /TAXON_ID=136452 /ORGANISM="Filamoeba nolandi, Strain NC-AS-23-1" /LENGTH=177 /DNA_ID=CAMNT_0008585453 /DNA_START=306 /DNA_END=839 /DNA_ORIENTATION=-
MSSGNNNNDQFALLSGYLQVKGPSVDLKPSKCTKIKPIEFGTLKLADHICYLTENGVYHHGLITKIQEELSVAHILPDGYYEDTLEQFMGYQMQHLYRVDYEQALEPQVSVEKAKQFVQYQPIDYHATAWNCEIFIAFCKTGQRLPSEQVQAVMSEVCKDMAFLTSAAVNAVRNKKS